MIFLAFQTTIFHIFSSLCTSAFCSCIIAKCSLKHCSTFNLWGKWLLFDIFNSELKNPQVFSYLDVWGHKNDFMLDWSNTKRNCCIRAGSIFGHWNAAYLSVFFMYFHTLKKKMFNSTERIEIYYQCNIRIVLINMQYSNRQICPALLYDIFFCIWSIMHEIYFVTSYVKKKWHFIFGSIKLKNIICSI